MAMIFSVAQAEVARAMGGQSVASQLEIAATAINQALREYNTHHNWDFKLETLADIVVSAGTAEYTLTSAVADNIVKTVYSARLKDNKKSLVYVRQREVDRVLRDQESSPTIPGFYNLIELPNTLLAIKLIPNPSQSDTLQVRVYDNIIIPVYTNDDADSLDIPDRLIPGLLELSKAYFLSNYDTHSGQAQYYLARGMQLLQKAIADDQGKPDEDVRLIPRDEWIGAQGSDLDDYDYWFTG